MPAMASKRQEAQDEPDEVEEYVPEEEPEDDDPEGDPEVVQQAAADIDVIPWRDAMEVAGLIEDIDPGDGLSSPEYVNPR